MSTEPGTGETAGHLTEGDGDTRGNPAAPDTGMPPYGRARRGQGLLHEAGGSYRVSYVIDTAIALRWLTGDAENRRAHALLERAISDRVTLIVPSLFWYEVGDILRRELDVALADRQQAMVLLAELPLVTVGIPPARMPDVVALADTHHLSIFDAAYLFVALHESVPLVTEDPDLTALRGQVPLVWILRDIIP